MNYNYQNYGQFGYNGYPYNNQNQQNYNQQQMQQNLNNYNNFQNNNMNQAQPYQQRAKCDFIAISNLEEVKSFIMNPNSTVLFKDVNNKIIYEKKTDSQGVSEIKAYQETNLTNNEYVRQNEFISFRNELESKINSLSQNLQKTIVGQNNSEKQGDLQ